MLGRLRAGPRARRGRSRGRSGSRPAAGCRRRPRPGRPIPGLVLDLDASIVVCHSEKEAATPTWKKTFGYHPLFCFLDNTREALSGMLREGRAGSNTTADHITVLDHALTQIPDAPPARHPDPDPVRLRRLHPRLPRPHPRPARTRRGRPVLRRCRGHRTDPPGDPARQAAPAGWVPALDADGEPRDGAEVCELTGLDPR